MRNRSGAKGLSAIVARLESWMHKTMAKCGGGERILELGAGTLNHMPYEPKAKIYDIVEPFEELWKDSPLRSQVTNNYADITDIPPDRLYDRLLSVAVLEHLTDLPSMVARSAMLLSQSGRFQAGIPSEGGFLWGMAWRCTTGVAYRLRTGLNYGMLMRHEHVNTAAEIIAVVRYFFADVWIRRFPLPFANLSFYTVLDACGPRQDRCAAFLAPPPRDARP